MDKMRLRIVLEPEDDGGYSVHCPALKGCHSQGGTREEALKNIHEAIELYLEVVNEKTVEEVKQQPRNNLIELAV